MHMDNCLVVGSGGIELVGVKAQIHLLATSLELRHPLPTLLVRADATVAVERQSGFRV